MYILVAFLICLFSAVGYVGFQRNANAGSTSNFSTGGLFDERGRYIMRNFDQSKPMSSFLAGIGGLWGIPMWAFYVNRGQGISSFGIQNKDNAISKFNTANNAYQMTPFTGFRTFVKATRGSNKWNHMPFFPLDTDTDSSLYVRDMMIGMNELEIREVAAELGLQTNVLYFTIANEDFPGLVRQTTLTNLDATSSLSLEVLDGLAKVIPSGLNNGVLDAMGRTMEAWMNVYNVGNSGAEGGSTQPFYHISQGTADVAQVQIIKDGHFSVSFIQPKEDDASEDPVSLLPFIVDPDLVFGTDTTLSNPRGFFGKNAPSLQGFMLQPQGTTSRTPCAFSGTTLEIPAGGNVTITTVFGHAEDLVTFISQYSYRIRSKGFIERKRKDANSIVESITSKVATTTASPLLDSYVKQSFLDNILRGGLPLLLGSPDKPKIYHTFSRIHGDIERDYNFFQIDTTYFSQGPGNFRDVNQNRRLDNFHTPAVGTFNIEMFLSFVQADGYNPLTVATTNFKVRPDAVNDLVKAFNIPDAKQADALTKLFAKPFRLGQLFKDIRSAGIAFNTDKQQLVNLIADASDQSFAGQFAQNGFWADHWTYTLDLIDVYLTIFPEKEENMLWDIESIPFFMSPAVVKSRQARYSLVDSSSNPGIGISTIRVYNAISIAGQTDYPSERYTTLAEITSDPDYVADSNGAGAPWQRSKLTGKPFEVSVITKLLMLSILKFSTLDPLGMGVEQEGGKPGWNDAMNGLPGLVGSGLSETYEMLRIIQYVYKALNTFQRPILIPTEFNLFITSLRDSLEAYSISLKDLDAEFTFWEQSNQAREVYRAATTNYFIGTYDSVSATDLISFLSDVQAKVNVGISRALGLTDKGVSPTYFYYECMSYKVADEKTSPPQILPTSFRLHKLPIFLEGPTRQMKTVSDIEVKRSIYRAVKSSEIYDQELKMFALSESLDGLSQEIGRMMAFSPGWLENQSIWLHMSYKFLLELIRGGLYDEFFEEMQVGLVPFMDNERYGRSPLEASSFIVSSAFPDKKLHGAGFLARLSGSTAEFLSMWSIMMAGHSPFVLDKQGQLSLQLKPILPAWLFTKDTNTVSFTFLGSCKVTYHNPNRVDTWLASPISAVVTDAYGHTSVDEDGILDAYTASKVREGSVPAIDLYFA